MNRTKVLLLKRDSSKTVTTSDTRIRATKSFYKELLRNASTTHRGVQHFSSSDNGDVLLRNPCP